MSEAAPPSSRRGVAIVGAGPAGLFAAELIAAAGNHVTIYERMPSPARKFLMAGRGGLNLTHSEALETFLTRYGAEAGEVRAAVSAFPPAALLDWAQGLGCETFVGSSGRVFPKTMKASPLLRAWLRRLAELGVMMSTGHEWVGFTPDGASRYVTASGEVMKTADATLLALGGASWPRLGTDGSWVDPLTAAGVEVSPLQPANCGVVIPWSEVFISRFEGAALKRIALRCGDASARGEAIVTKRGLEGGAVYQLIPAIRECLRASGAAQLFVDLKPDTAAADLSRRLERPRGGATLTAHLRKTVNVDPAAIGLLREVPIPDSPEELANRIKAMPLPVSGLAGIDRAISTAGGVAWRGFDDGCMLIAHPGVFVAGEMLDWEAPTGGYLLQATFATAYKAAHGVLRWLDTASQHAV